MAASVPADSLAPASQTQYILPAAGTPVFSLRAPRIGGNVHMYTGTEYRVHRWSYSRRARY